MDRAQIEQYLGFLGQKLNEMQTRATLVLLGGALMVTQVETGSQHKISML